MYSNDQQSFERIRCGKPVLGETSMKKLEVFFDYACPYCLTGHQNLIALLPDFPDIKVVWRPCESHPRPDRYGPHSDLCIQGLFFAEDNGVDVWAYHERAYSLIAKRRREVENRYLLADCFSDLMDSAAFRDALVSGRYMERLKKANHYAFRKSGVWVVPAYRMDGRKLDAIENVGVRTEQLRSFLQNA
jgi:predicted DsbA family dithiol-disulfide isomerase